MLRLAARGFPQPDLDWDFQCECGVASCEQEVPLPVLLYDDLRASGEFVLAQGHSLQRPEHARVWLRESEQPA